MLHFKCGTMTFKTDDIKYTPSGQFNTSGQMWCASIHDMTYMLTAIGLTPSDSSTVHSYTQTVHRTRQLTRRTTNLTRE